MAQVKLGGPMFAPATSDFRESIFKKQGGHYNIFRIDGKEGMEYLRNSFPDGKANEYGFVLFSTSGVHGSYATIEEIARSIKKYGEMVCDCAACPFDDNCPPDFHSSKLTIVLVQPRIVALHYGNIRVGLGDIAFLKKLRKSSRKAMVKIG